MADIAFQSQVLGQFRRKKLMSLALPGLALAYLVYIIFAFDLMGLAQRARLDNGLVLMADAVSYKVHVTRDNRRQSIEASIEGSRRMTFAPDQRPDWMQIDGDHAVVNLPNGNVVTYDGPQVTWDMPGYGLIRITIGSPMQLDLPTNNVPDFINASRSRVTVTSPDGRLTVTRSRTEVMRYFPGWELFFFDMDSPFHAMSWTEIGQAVLSGARIDPQTPNAALVVSDFLNNSIWRHADVFAAIGETVLMAFLGTLGAAALAIPLAFFAASNFTPARIVRFAVRRVLDFVRGVDALIFTIILSRAFGPGPMTGALAILITDTGTFGKLFSEALENVDGKQIEGIRSTGARPLQRYRFGVIPQVMPVFLSQMLYMFESNTRSATIVGAIVGGGIGLLLTQAIQTTVDWEKVTYYILLIVLMVFAMDALSGWMRRRLIKGDSSGR